MSKQLILYPLSQPLLEHDIPPWFKEDEDKVYSTVLYALEISMGGKPQYEYEMIENMIQNPPPNVSPLEEIIRETQKSPHMIFVRPTPLLSMLRI